MIKNGIFALKPNPFRKCTSQTKKVTMKKNEASQPTNDEFHWPRLHRRQWTCLPMQRRAACRPDSISHPTLDPYD